MLYEAMLLFIVTLSTTIIMMSVSSYSYCGLSFECECGAWFFSWFVFGADLSDFARGSSKDFRFFDAGSCTNSHVVLNSIFALRQLCHCM